MDVILIATNDRATKDALELILGNSCVLFRAGNFHEVAELLQDNPIDVALVDENLDGGHISEALALISKVNKYVQVLVLAADPKSALARNCLTLGAQDVIKKPPLEEEVITSVQKAIEHARLQRSVDFLAQAKADEESRLRAAEERLAALHRTNLSIARNTYAASFASFHKALVNIRDAQRLFELIVEALMDVFPLTNAAIVLKGADGQTLAVKACKGLDEELVKRLKFDARAGLALWLRRNGGIFVTERRGGDGGGEELAGIMREAELLRAKVCVPLLSDGKLLGFLSVGKKISDERFGDDELQSMFQLATYAAGAIENAISYDDIGSQKTNFERIVRFATTGIVAADAGARIIAINEKAAHLLGVISEQVVGSHAQKLGSIFSHFLMQTLQDKKTYSNEKVTDPVSKAPLMVSVSPLENASAETVGAVMLLTDISALPEGADVVFGEMVKMKFLSDILNDTIGNSLVPISILSQNVKGKGDFEKQAKRAEKEIEDLSNLTKIFADFAELSISAREYDLHQFLNDWVRGKEDQIENQHIKMAFTSELTDPMASFDPGRLGQALEEIVENSIESFVKTQEDKRIDIFARDQYKKDGPKQTDALEISITDNGSGIDEEKIKTVFEPFYSSGRGSKTLGLGLSIARKIIELHGGSIEIESKEGEGTTVRIILPKSA